MVFRSPVKRSVWKSNDERMRGSWPTKHRGPETGPPLRGMSERDRNICGGGLGGKSKLKSLSQIAVIVLGQSTRGVPK